SDSFVPRCQLWNFRRLRRISIGCSIGFSLTVRQDIEALCTAVSRRRRHLRPDPMRPQILYSLYAPITSLPGVGPRVGPLLEKLTGPHVVDVCWHLPSSII